MQLPARSRGGKWDVPPLAMQVDWGQICAVIVTWQQCAPIEQIKKRLDVNIVQMGGDVGSQL